MCFRNCELAFKLASTKLSIPDLLDADDIAGYDHPDPLSIMTYLSQFYHAFSAHSSSERRGRSVSRQRSGAMQRLFDESRRARSVSLIRGLHSSVNNDPSVDSENPFRNNTDTSLNYDTIAPRREKKKMSDHKTRVRSLFLDNLDRAPLSRIVSHDSSTRPRHVLSHSSYARPYSSNISLPTSSMCEGLDTLDVGNTKKEKKSSLKKGSEKIANFVKSNVEKFQKKDSSQNFESKLKCVVQNEPIKYTLA